MKAEVSVSWIPELPDAQVQELAERIKPVVEFEGVKRYIMPVDLFGVAYTWDPKPARKAGGLVGVADIRTYHTFGYYGFFKPSIAEVLRQIPEEYLEQTVAFEIIDVPETADDLRREQKALDAGYHVATTRLYIKA